MIPKEANYIDVYLAINSQYHNYICLFKQWFNENDVDCKIIQSAIHYWFNDDDWAYKDKVQKLLNESNYRGKIKFLPLFLYNKV